MSERIILHCDLNNFFASVESFYKPELKTVPMAVCGSVEERHGIVLAKNEIAKAFGIVTAEPVWQAKQKCRDLVIVPPQYDKYVEFSDRAKKVYGEFTDLVEPFGIDECWLDVTNSTKLFGSGEEIALQIKEKMKQELGITISVGVSFNKVFAKLGSDLKKPDAITVLSKENFKDRIYNLKAEEMIGIGKKTKQKLNSLGIYTIGELAFCDKKILELTFGKLGVQLWAHANGHDYSPVIAMKDTPAAKSYGRSLTRRNDLKNNEQVKRIFLYLCEKVATSLRENHVLASTVAINVRDTNLVTREFQKQLTQPSRLVQTLLECAMELFEKNWTWANDIRSIGISAQNLMGEKSHFQLNLFCDTVKNDNQEKLESEVFNIRKKFGNKAIVRATAMNLNINENKSQGFKNVNQVK
ncbi:MAG: DNA polymerase IV [Clostridia bacterium]